MLHALLSAYVCKVGDINLDRNTMKIIAGKIIGGVFGVTTINLAFHTSQLHFLACEGAGSSDRKNVEQTS